MTRHNGEIRMWTSTAYTIVDVIVYYYVTRDTDYCGP